MIKNIISTIIIIGLVVVFNSCEDPETAFNPINPDLAINAVVGVPGSTQSIVTGANRQLSIATNELVVISEITSDNYVNTATFFNQFLDNVSIDPTDDDIDDTQFAIHRLRELALTGRDIVAPADENSTEEQIAEFNFLIGYSHLLFGESFRSVPAEPGGPVMDAATHLNVAISSFQAALDGSPDASILSASNIGLARANYKLGNRTEAVQFANAAIAADPAFVRFADYDAVNLPENVLQNALFDRGSFDDLQPLPRLDFLDPKYNGSDAAFDFGIPIMKIEDAHLIKIEASISEGNLGDAQQTMKDVIALVATRPTADFSDAVEGRTQDAPGSRPDSTNVVVSASSSAPARPGLVLDRNDGNVVVPTVSGTSVTDAMVDAIGSADEALALLYLMRQEIFIAEGRRMSDLGIQFVTSDVEFRINDNVSASDIVPEIPAFISSINTELDAFTYDAAAGTVTIMHDLNSIIVQNKTSAAVAPFE